MPRVQGDNPSTLTHPALGGPLLVDHRSEGWVLSIMILPAKARVRTEPGLTLKPVLFKSREKTKNQTVHRYFL